MFGEEAVGEPIDPDECVQFHDAGNVARLKSGDGQIQRLLQAVVNPLTD
jgi:hypothetical protein